jgi:hypothetical protein
MATWNAPIALTTKSSTRYKPIPTTSPCSVPSYDAASTPTTACDRTRLSPTSLHSNSSANGNEPTERQSVTNLLGEYNPYLMLAHHC